MKLPWSKGDKKLDLEPTTGNDATDETAIEKKLGLSSVGTYVLPGSLELNKLMKQDLCQWCILVF